MRSARSECAAQGRYGALKLALEIVVMKIRNFFLVRPCDSWIHIPKAERRQIRRAAWKQLNHSRSTFERFMAVSSIPFVMLILIIILITIMASFADGWLNIDYAWIFMDALHWVMKVQFWTFVPSVIIMVLVALKVFYIPFIRSEMREAGWEVCRGCGYLLRGVAKKVTECPECGRKHD